jgi:hypothetical protein
MSTRIISSLSSVEVLTVTNALAYHNIVTIFLEQFSGVPELSTRVIRSRSNVEVLTGTNAPAYYNMRLFTAIKSFTVPALEKYD